MCLHSDLLWVFSMAAMVSNNEQFYLFDLCLDDYLAVKMKYRNETLNWELVPYVSEHANRAEYHVGFWLGSPSG